MSYTMSGSRTIKDQKDQRTTKKSLLLLTKFVINIIETGNKDPLWIFDSS